MPSGLLSGWLCVALTFAPANGRTDAPRPSPSSKPDKPSNGKKTGKNGDTPPAPFANAALREADEAWRKGDYAEVRRWLEPLAADPKLQLEPQDRQTMLVLLADATLSDTSLDAADRRDQARAHLDRLLELDRDWRMPRDIYTPELYDLYVEVRIERAGRTGQECEAGLIVCKSDNASAQDVIVSEQRKLAALDKKYGEQQVEVREVVARSRILAAIPGGFGHFYNGNPALGGSFLAAELIFAGAGLGLLIHRNVVDGCTRTRGFQSGSLVCDIRGEDDPDVLAEREDDIQRRRKAEEAMAWLLLGTIALDIVIAQILFKPTKTRIVKRVPRNQLDAEEAKRARTGTTPPRPAKPRAKVRAAPSFGPTSVGLAFDIRF